MIESHTKHNDWLCTASKIVEDLLINLQYLPYCVQHHKRDVRGLHLIRLRRWNKAVRWLDILRLWVNLWQEIQLHSFRQCSMLFIIHRSCRWSLYPHFLQSIASIRIRVSIDPIQWDKSMWRHFFTIIFLIHNCYLKCVLKLLLRKSLKE